MCSRSSFAISTYRGSPAVLLTLSEAGAGVLVVLVGILTPYHVAYTVRSIPYALYHTD
jgi:hypothetical protein